MKKSKCLFTLLTLVALTGCGGGNNNSSSKQPVSSSEQTSQESSESKVDSTSSGLSEIVSSESSESVTTIENYTVAGKVKNAFGGDLIGAKVTLKGTSTTCVVASDGAYSIVVPSSGEHVLVVEKEGFETTEVDVSAALGKTENVAFDLDVAKAATKYGKLVDKTWENYEAFEGYVTRDASNMIFKIKSANKVFVSEGRDSRIEVYISTGTVNAERDAGVFQVNVNNAGTVYAKNFANGDITSGVSAVVKTSDAGTEIEIKVSHVTLGIEKDAIIGVSMGLWSENDKDWAPMNVLETTQLALVESPSGYVRVDKDNRCFVCKQNCYPEDLPAETYDKAALTEGHDINFADPTYCNNKTDSDDIYVKTTKTAGGFIFNMVGFGSFADNEVIKMVIHTSETNAGGWGLQTDDVVYIISKTKATSKTGLTDFWAYNVMAEGDSEALIKPEYTSYEGYFTIDFAVYFSELPGYDAKGQVSIGFWEFAAGTIYDATPFSNGMFHNGAPVGDLANQSNYAVIQEATLSVDKETLTRGYDIEFSKGGGDIFAKFEHGTDSLKLSMIGFKAFADSSFVRLITKTGTDNKGGWGLEKTDVSFSIYKDKAYSQTNVDSFWTNEATCFHGADSDTLYTPTFTADASGEYWTMTFDIDYTEIGASVSASTVLKGMLIEFSPSIQNNGFLQNGEVKGDIADQNNYFTI